MNAVFTILTVLIIIASVLLVIVVLLQNSKGDGMASNFVAGNQTFGVRQTADILEKITWGLVVFIFLFSIIASFTTKTNSGDIDVTDKIENVTKEQQPEFPSAPIQAETPSETAPSEPAAAGTAQ